VSDERLVDDGRGSGRGADIGDQRGAPRGSNRGGGPKTPRGLARVERNLRQPGGSNLRHGIYPFKRDGITPLCRACKWRQECEAHDPERYDPSGHCWRLAEYQEDLAREIGQLEHIKPEDRHLVRLLCQDMALKALIDVYVADSEPNVPASLAKERGACANRIVKIVTELGLSPRSRAALKITEAGGAMAQILAVHQELDEERVARAEGTVEGQFELFDEAEASSEAEPPADASLGELALAEEPPHGERGEGEGSGEGPPRGERGEGEGSGEGSPHGERGEGEGSGEGPRQSEQEVGDE
jgi:hypothetical protein